MAYLIPQQDIDEEILEYTKNNDKAKTCKGTTHNIHILPVRFWQVQGIRKERLSRKEKGKIAKKGIEKIGKIGRGDET